MHIERSGSTCGATVHGVDLSGPLDSELISEIRSAWLKHRVLAFADQSMDDDALERLTIAMGGFGEDPYFAPIEGREHIAAILREADETSPLFAEKWHSDWSFLPDPPAGTCLMAVDIPSTGGDTLFADQIAAFAALPEDRKTQLRRLNAVHSAIYAYSPDGEYGERDKGRSMAIRPDESARQSHVHPLIRQHPETGEEAIFSTLGYIVGIEGMAQNNAFALLAELAQWQSRDEFVYSHKWQPGMVVMWDNRSVLHRATGGYEGQRRELHRTTIAAWKP
ncbi:MAG: TauD/TfdA family dioxygenase [Altererythrobacter sp.]|nr:TauD/TfdA family dioxygenase [Altererythrobacter sp.]